MDKMWGGVFNKKTNLKVEEYTKSILTDKVLLPYDLKYSSVHAQALEKAGVLSKKEVSLIVKTLKDILKEAEESKIKIDKNCEDIHSFIENLLYKKVGDLAKKLHAGRSRNDQIMVLTRMYCKDALAKIIKSLNVFEKALIKSAENNADIIIPAFTHMQDAQPVLFSHYICAFIEMFKRDISRLEYVKNKMMVLPAGSAACTGTSVDLDLNFIAHGLGFDSIAFNSIDAVSDRDFMVEILSDLSILFMHFSRLSEDLIIWSSKEFGLITIDDSFCTGSSIMPHKKNPDVLELVRGESSHIFGNVFSMLSLLKGLPTSYNRDLQLDKPYLFGSLNLTLSTAELLADLVKTVKINKKAAIKLLENEYLYITDIAEWLVSKGMPFRQAHQIMGNVIKYAQNKKIKLKDIPCSKLKEFSDLFTDEFYSFFDPEVSVNRKVTFNSTSPVKVKEKLSSYKKEFK